MSKIKTGLIGYGFSGATFHAPLIRTIEDYELVKVVSKNPDKVHRDFPGMDVIPDTEELFADPEIDLVIITSPNTSHYPLAKQALLAGKHTVLEKPFVNSVKEAEDLIRLAEEQDRLLSVYHNRRWDSDFLTVRRCIESGQLGEIYYYEAHFDRFRVRSGSGWRDQDLDGSGTLFDLGSHLIDQALCLFGLPKTVSADVSLQLPGSKSVDYFHLLLNYERVKVILHSGSVVKSQGPRFEVHGTKGSFLKYGTDPQEAALKQGKGPNDPEWGKEAEKYYGQLTTENEGVLVRGTVESVPGSYESYYKGIADAILGRGAVPVPAVDAGNVIKVIECAMRSSREQRVVSFD